MTKGIIIIATGHHLYGRMAYNLAVSIKAKDKALPIALVYNQSAMSHLSNDQWKIFDQLIPTDKGWREIRFAIPEITPFDKTLFLDVDMLWIRDNPAEVFDILDKTNFACVNEGFYEVETGIDKTNKNYGFGADLKEMISKHKIKNGKVWKMRGEFMLFNKSKKIIALFQRAGAIYNSPGITTALFAGAAPTEFAFDIAMNKMRIDCHKPNWQPAYWPSIHKGIIPELHTINKAYYAFSAGGARVNYGQKRIYDLVMQAACYKLGLKHVFHLQPKNFYIPERIKKQNA